MATIFDEPSGCNCANVNSYTKAQINAACTQALKLASEKKTVGEDKYPHVYNDDEKFNFGNAQKPYLEFPILQNETAYTGNESPGADRIVIGSIATDYESAIFCAVITHDGQKNDAFVECKDDTVNTNGSGTFEGNSDDGDDEDDEGQRGKKHHHHKKHYHKREGRHLLDRIDY